METTQSNFEGWAVVELMGHQREIGYVTTETFGQSVLFRIETPELPELELKLDTHEWVDGAWCGAGSAIKRQSIPAYSRLVSLNALYAINPCSETEALNHLNEIHPHDNRTVVHRVDPPREIKDTPF